MKLFILICGVILLTIAALLFVYPIFKKHIIPATKPADDIKFVIMDETSYGREYSKAFDSEAAKKILTKKEIEAEFDQFDTLLREKLSQKWGNVTKEEYETFEVSYEWQGTFHHCGGIYSKHIYLPEYVATIVDVMSSLPNSKHWTYHTVCEATDFSWVGEFFIRNNTFYAPKDGNDYLKYFGTTDSIVEYFQGNDPMIQIREAVINKDLALTKKLVTSNADLVNTRDNAKSTPLHHAAESGQIEIVKLLIENGAKIDAQDVLEWTPLHCACSKDTGLSVIPILLKANANIHLATSDGETALHIAAFNNQTSSAKLLLDAGANANGVVQGKDTPLHEAAILDNAEVATLLIQRGANVDAIGDGGFTPLHRSAYQGALNVCILLITNGSNVNILDEKGKSPLFISKYHNHEQISLLLRKHGAK